MAKNIKRTERGWAGHFCCSDSCKFRRNTLLEYNGVFVVASTVGKYYQRGRHEFAPLGGDNRIYETMAFYSDKNDSQYHDADVSNDIVIDCKSEICDRYDDNEANDMHESVIKELSEKLLNGKI